MAISDYLNSLIKDKKNLVANLNEKGVEASDNETFTELAPKILDIQGGLDWSEIGYSGTPQLIIDGFDYAKKIYDNWTPKTSLYEYFKDDTQLVYMPLVDTSKTTNFTSIFYNCSALTTVPVFDMSSETGQSMLMFSGCSSLKEIPLLDFSKIKSFRNMFQKCSSLKTLPPINTSSGTDFSDMFNYCTVLEEIPLIDVSNGTNLSEMFNYCYLLKAIPNLNCSSATKCNSMFNYCTGLTSLKLSLPKAQNISRIFGECNMLTEVELTNLSNVTDVSHMFHFCSSLKKVVLTGLVPSNIKNYNSMFLNAPTSCLILVDTEEVKSWIKTNFPSYKNVFLIDEAHTINISNDNIEPLTSGYKGISYDLKCLEDKKIVTSFYLNGKLIEGNTFTMPDENVEITNITISDGYIIESNHNPYQANLNINELVTFENATSLQITAEAEFGYWNDSMSVKNSAGRTVISIGGTTGKTQTVNVSGNSATVICSTKTTSYDKYGFKVTIIPEYDE